MAIRELALLATVVGASTASAMAGAYIADFTPSSQNANGGDIDRITARYDTDTNQLDYTVVFGNQVTEGFTLAISPGQNPKNQPGELALFYFDASDMNAPKVTAYGYNGQNNQTSWTDGDSSTGGSQQADLIMSDLQLGLSDAKISFDDNIDGTRTLGFSIDASSIINHNPLYPSPTGDDWTGASFFERIGIWFHTFKTFDADYDANGNITDLTLGGEGWFDGSNIATTFVPMPGAAGMTLAGLGLVARRRRTV